MSIHGRDSGETEGKKKTSLTFTHEEAMGIGFPLTKPAFLPARLSGVRHESSIVSRVVSQLLHSRVWTTSGSRPRLARVRAAEWFPRESLPIVSSPDWAWARASWCREASPTTPLRSPGKAQGRTLVTAFKIEAENGN